MVIKFKDMATRENREYVSIKESMDRFRKALRESAETQDAIPYGKDDELYQSSIESVKTQVGADFSAHPNPLLYYPDGDVTLSGTIPSLNSAKFQFRFKDTNGCYLWTDCVTINDESVNTIAKLNGVYKNWKKNLEMMEDVKPICLSATIPLKGYDGGWQISLSEPTDAT